MLDSCSFNNMETKKCSKCGEVKLFSEFSKHKSHKDGLSSQCLKCIRIKHKENYQTRKDYYKARSKRFCEVNKEYILNYQKEYRSKPENKRKHREYIKKQRKEHPEIRRKEWRVGVDNTANYYIKKLLIRQNYLKEMINPTLIEEKRNIIKTKRIISKINQSINKKTKTL